MSASFDLQRSNKGPLENSRQGAHNRTINPNAPKNDICGYNYGPPHLISALTSWRVRKRQSLLKRISSNTVLNMLQKEALCTHSSNPTELFALTFSTLFEEICFSIIVILTGWTQIARRLTEDPYRSLTIRTTPVRLLCKPTPLRARGAPARRRSSRRG
jgi:hypothetical protein